MNMLYLGSIPIIWLSCCTTRICCIYGLAALSGLAALLGSRLLHGVAAPSGSRPHLGLVATFESKPLLGLASFLGIGPKSCFCPGKQTSLRYASGLENGPL